MEATQEATQPCTDPRRLGHNNSGLLGDDVSDVICILHPNSLYAHDAVAATANIRSDHILQREKLAYESADTAALDIALRLSSNVRDLGSGFCFGRNPSRCDILLSADDSSKRISNCHFRIYLTNDGILMLEDTSTNGTLVDNNRIRKNEVNSRMLTNGSVIQVVHGPQASDEVRFIVRMPSRDTFAMQYTENIVRYLERVQKHQTGVAQPITRQGSQPLQWAVAQTFGMHWTGGAKYNITGQIGKGAFATVYKLATKQHGIVFAAKELEKTRLLKTGTQKVDNEMRIMRDLKHPNIVQYVDYHEHDRWIYIIMEYVPCGELSTYLHNCRTISEPVVQQMTRQILHALKYLHNRRITHRDIKPDNILISSFEPFRVKLSDFGLSKVVQEESFLKTFCGTLLYCAPEVYPEYATYRAGEVRKRRRFGDPPPKTTPYDQSVDIWSFGAVLYHILAGVPPYMGSAEDRGAKMLRVIMTTDPDYDRLRQAGISEAGIDFVSRLLNRDPHSRPNERECFQHPWIANVEDVDEYEDDDIQPDDFGGALSDIGEDIEGELDASQLSLDEDAEEPDSAEGNQLAQSKRPRIDNPPADIRYPSLPALETPNNIQPGPENTPKRLFGEITPAALPSSHALGVGASMEAYDGDDYNVRDFYSSAGESMISDASSLNSIISLPEFPFGGSAPSLMGAENQVRQLKMNSSQPAIFTGVETPTKRTSPADKHEEAPTGGNVPTPGRASRSQSTPKASKFSRRIELPLPDSASNSSSNGSKPASIESRSKSSTKSHTTPAAAAAVDDELAVTLDARTGKEIPIPSAPNSQPQSDCIPPELSIPRIIPPLQSRKNRPLLGKLTSVPGSILDITIRLETRMTSWGRGPLATVCYTDPLDTRIPAYALEVTFWTPAIEARIAAGDDWMAIPGVMAILSTKTRNCIWVNDTELRRGDENGRPGLQFGKLYTGDIITVYKQRNKFLKLQCEFYHGDSSRPRPDHEKGFTVRKILKSKKEDTGANRQPVQRKNNLKK